MAHIKCRYTIAYCTYRGNRERVYHDDWWWCDDWGGCGPEVKYTKPKESGNVVNPTCVFCEYSKGEFEKTVKQYEYTDGDLTVGKQTYTEFEIYYLEIDGRVLVDDEEGEG